MERYASPYVPTAGAAVASVCVAFTAWFGMEQRGSQPPRHVPILVALTPTTHPLTTSSCTIARIILQSCLPSAIRCSSASCRRAATDDRSAVCCCLLYRSHGLHSNPVPVSSRRCLSYFHTWMTDLVAGFPLRCCQRFSVPDVATEPCGSSHNSSTSGLSSPVLSY